MSPSSGHGARGLTLREAAEVLGVHYMTAYGYVRTGRLEAAKVGNTWRVERRAVERLRRSEPVARGRRGAGRVDRRTAHTDLLLSRLLADDEAGAWKVLGDALSWGRSPEQLLFDVVSPALVRVGELWQKGLLDVSGEHSASVTVARLLGRLGPQFYRRGPRRGVVVMGAPAGELHGLPVALVADPLRGRGFRVVDLGANTPAASFAHAAKDSDGLLAVAIAATRARNDDAVRAAIRAVHRAVDVPVILGGAAVRSKARAERLGADLYSPNGQAVLELVESLRAGS